MKKLVALFLALLMVAACTLAVAEVPEGYPEIVTDENGNPIDLGGMTIYLYDYWSGENNRSDNPTDEQQATYDYQDWLMQTYNFTYKQMQKGDWGSNVQELINFCSAPVEGEYALYILPPDFVSAPMSQNLLAAWNYDVSGEKWNAADVAMMTKAGVVYGAATGASEPRQCLYFNKQVLEAAGIDWNTIYDMQANGTWTWDAFEAMLKQVQQDTDNDGVVDIWGMTGSNVDMYRVAVFANGGKFFDYDENGNLCAVANSDNTLEALTWSKDIFNTYFFQQPADGQWDYYKSAWLQGNHGFYMYQTYGGFNPNSEMSSAEFDWGCVAFPVGPKGETFVHIASDNITVIPAVYTEDEVAKMIFAYDLMTDATPGYDDEDSWIQQKYDYTDDRAVDETYAWLRQGEHTVTDAVLSFGSVNDIEGQDYLWNLAGATPAELYETKLPVWQDLLNTFNAK